LPDYENAIYPEGRFKKYLLDEDNINKDAYTKARFFKALGYTKDNWEELKNQISEQLPFCEAISKGDKGYGETFEVSMKFKGRNNTSAQIITAWIIDSKTGRPRIVTAYQDKKGNNDD
jgi:hypothetical protein